MATGALSNEKRDYAGVQNPVRPGVVFLACLRAADVVKYWFYNSN
jgi:hypothetical protein